MNLIHLSETSSTNTYLKELLKSQPNLPEYTTVSCYRQLQGRGQKGSSWESNPGENITCSILLCPTLPPGATTFDLNIATSLALRDLLTHYQTPGVVQVKWPNDIMVEQRKIAGILIENEWLGSLWHYAIVGIGLNVLQIHFQKYHPQATSMALERSRLPNTDSPHWQEKMIREIAHCLARRMAQLTTHLDEIRAEYQQHLLGYHNEQCYRLPSGKTLVGTIESVHPNGLLEITTKEQNRVCFAFKEISWLGKATTEIGG